VQTAGGRVGCIEHGSCRASSAEQASALTQVVEDMGTVVYATFARNQYGFDIYSTSVVDDKKHLSKEERLTDGQSINFNGAFSTRAPRPSFVLCPACISFVLRKLDACLVTL